jgi:hypothetical protein
MGWQLFRDRTHGAVNRGEHSVPAHDDTDALFWASPVGRATQARLRGDRFFQIELDGATLAAYAEAATDLGEGGARRAPRAGDLLGQIEELGWRLEHVSWWRVDSDEPITQNGSPVRRADPDHVRGVYLFHSAPDPEAGGSSTEGTEGTEGAEGTAVGATRAPTHRREVR